MTERRPLVLIAGQLKELPSGDTVPALPGTLNIMSFYQETYRSTAHNSGLGDFVFGFQFMVPTVVSAVRYRGITADGSGNMTVKLQKNGSDTGMTGSSKTIAAADQVAGGSASEATGTWSFAAGDILTVVLTAVGTNPGRGLIAALTVT